MWVMTRTQAPLLAELHAHTTWSDGEFSIAELVELYGHAGFDVLAVTDHVVRSAEGLHVRAETSAPISPRSTQRRSERPTSSGSSSSPGSS